MPGTYRFETISTTSVLVQSVKFCVRTAHTGVTEKYDGDAALTARGRLWEAA